jgi:hypothetical protein
VKFDAFGVVSVKVGLLSGEICSHLAMRRPWRAGVQQLARGDIVETAVPESEVVI